MSIDHPQICVARQAIFDPQSRIFAHEILYRGSAEHATAQSSSDPVETTREVIRNIVFGIGLHKLLSGVKGFLNVPHQLLDDRVLEALPANQLSLEILETAEPTWEALLACRKLRSLGFSLILDDYFGQPHLKPFLDIVDFVKVDVKQASTDDVARIPGDFHARGIQVVAEKVETEQEFELFRSLGSRQARMTWREFPAISMLAASRLSLKRWKQSRSLSFSDRSGLITFRAFFSSGLC
jgi:EAL and modified HD-GYP domain-containing signal transduction protein